MLGDSEVDLAKLFVDISTKIIDTPFQYIEHLKVDWQFDQPERIKMTPDLRDQLGEGERLNISFTNVDCLTLSEEDKKDEAKVSPKIHMILPQH